MSPAQQATHKRRPLPRHSAAKRRKNIPTSRQNLAPRLRWQTTVICLALAVGTIALYSPVAVHPFIGYDDPSYVTGNEHVLSGVSWQTFSWALTANYSSNWHPLTWLSHALDCQLYGLNAGGHHVTNLLIHAVNVLLLFLLLWRATRAAGASAMVAALFAIHPLNVESVAWVAERKNVLSMFFFLLALGAYGWYVQRPSWKRYGLAALFFAMGLASKPMVITLPFVLLLLDYWPLGRFQGWTTPSPEVSPIQLPWFRLALEKMPLLLLSMGSAAITIVAQRSGNSIEPMPLSWRLENAVYAYATYVARIFWPVNLALIYPHPLNSLTAAQITLSLLFLLGVTVFVWQQRRKKAYAVTGWLWFLGTLMPVIGIIQVGAQGMADRYMYLPAIGLFLIVVWGAVEFIRARSLNSRFVAAASIAVLATLSVVTFRQIGYWRTSYDLWNHTLEVTTNNVVADDYMGELLAAEGRHEALVYFEAAARIAPWDPESHAAVAANFHDHGDLQQAIDEYDIALRAKPDAKLRARIYAYLGVIYRQLGDYPTARENSRLALSSDAQEVQTIIRQVSDTLARHPAASGYWLLGLLLEGEDHITEAKSAYGQALRLKPDFVAASRALAEVETNEERSRIRLRSPDNFVRIPK